MPIYYNSLNFLLDYTKPMSLFVRLYLGFLDMPFTSVTHLFITGSISWKVRHKKWEEHLAVL